MFSIVRQISKTDVWSGGNLKKYIILHDTASQPKTTWENIIKFFKRKDEISIHFTVNYDGQIIQLADEDDRCFHVGRSSYGTDKDLNHCSIGIEVFHNGQPFTNIQREATIWLIKDLMKRHHVPVHRVLRHADVAWPRGRKQDIRQSFYAPYGGWGDFQAKLLKR